MEKKIRKMTRADNIMILGDFNYPHISFVFLCFSIAEAKTCRRPNNILNGFIANRGTGPYFHGASVRYECAEGFAVVGTNPAKCLHGKWDLPSCADGCARPKLPKNTNPAPLKKRYNNNEVVTYSCGSSQHRSKCVNGNWSPKPDCRELCPPPPQPPNAIEIIEVKNYENGEKVRFTCKEHFMLEGPEEIVCEDGKWKTPPRCIDASCGNPPPIVNGGAVNGTQGKYLPGTKVEYHCDEGFGISGISFSTCRNRSWTPIPNCQENPCDSPPQIFDASLHELEKKSYHPGETVHYMCHPGFVATGPLNVTCRKGEWTEPPNCEDAACGDPPTVTYADIISGRRDIYRPDHQVQYRCRKGFEISGSDNVTCGIRVWSEPPTCKDVTCPPPSEIDHGEITGQLKERYMPYDTVHYRCETGWNLSGPLEVTCLKKKWTKLPRCVDAAGNCGRPPAIQNGDILDTIRAFYPRGTRLQYKCQNLYRMNGSSEVRCENGLWTEPPTCIEACTVSEEDMARNHIQLKWRSDAKLYSESGDMMEFTCNWGYRKDPLSPPFRVQCIEGRVVYPRCIHN
ncbi:complement factor H-like [Sphaerodactylus townsendi]|uniref:complement factor H-like n=1 Tax=Sphaerodactylus townsendi TaxID=933632 RepID=UPI002026E76B|nr:complement factor H-like [Sphaerodactylus townsendi]